MKCGRPEKEVVFADSGYSAAAKKGYAWNSWALPVYHCRAGNDVVEIELSVPRGAQGKLRLYVIDPDNFEGGRRQTVTVAGKLLATIERFEGGKWLEAAVAAEQTAEGKLTVQARNARQGSNAVISIIEWLEGRE
jgi:hypothetical protein